MKIAIFGGTFDPVHVEHINIVKAAKANWARTKSSFCPRLCRRINRAKRSLRPPDRLEMTRRAFEPVRGCEVSAYEINAKGTSFTYLTLEYYKNKFPDAELYFLVGLG